MATSLKALQDEAFEALAPFTTPGGALDEELWAGEAQLCASHDAAGCPLCGWVM